MSDDMESFLQEFRSIIESRLRENLKRHLGINPTGDPKQIVDIQIAQEKERIERLCEKYDAEGKDNMADLLQALADNWLPELARELKRR